MDITAHFPPVFFFQFTKGTTIASLSDVFLLKGAQLKKKKSLLLANSFHYDKV